MGRRRSTSVALILLVLGLVGMGVVVLAWWPLPSVTGSGTAADVRPVTATVVSSARCGSATSRDLVALTVDGRRVEVRFNGCGHREGQELRVLVPVEPEDGFVAQPATAAASATGTDARDLRERLTWVLLTLAGVAGAGYALLLRPRP